MIPTAEEFVQETEKEEQSNFKLGIVVELFENKTAKIQFDGEDIPSEKQYAYLESYKPTENDRVLLAAIGGTYIVLGKVNYDVSPPEEEKIDRYVFDQKTVSILKGLQVSGAFTVNNGMTVTGSVGVDGAITATSLSSSGNITASGSLSGDSLNTSGTLSAGDTTLSKLNVSGSTTLSGLTVKNTIYANNGLMHRGGISFFGSRGLSAKRNVGQLYGTADINAVVNKLNNLISALQGYGLIG